MVRRRAGVLGGGSVGALRHRLLRDRGVSADTDDGADSTIGRSEAKREAGERQTTRRRCEVAHGGLFAAVLGHLVFGADRVEREWLERVALQRRHAESEQWRSASVRKRQRSDALSALFRCRALTSARKNLFWNSTQWRRSACRKHSSTSIARRTANVAGVRERGTQSEGRR